MKHLAAALFCLAAMVGAAPAGTADDLLATYRAFAAAQNARDPERIGAFLHDDPQPLWVSDGKAFWGRDAIVARMSGFQEAAVWRVEPDIDQATVVELSPTTALTHMPLTLVIGSAEAPDRLRFLVSLVWVRDAADWRIAALLTTAEKP